MGRCSKFLQSMCLNLVIFSDLVNFFVNLVIFAKSPVAELVRTHALPRLKRRLLCSTHFSRL